MFQFPTRSTQTTGGGLPPDLCQGQRDDGPGDLPGRGLHPPAGPGGRQHGQTSAGPPSAPDPADPASGSW